MRFAYVQLPAKRPIYSLGGAHVRPRAIIPVQMTGPGGSVLLDCCLDNGTDDTLFPRQVATTIGIPLTGATNEGEGQPIGGTPIRYPYGRVTLRVTDGLEACKWEAIVGFIDTPVPWPLLGFAGFLQFFDADLRGSAQEVILTPNSSFPGQVANQDNKAVLSAPAEPRMQVPRKCRPLDRRQQQSACCPDCPRMPATVRASANGNFSVLMIDCFDHSVAGRKRGVPCNNVFGSFFDTLGPTSFVQSRPKGFHREIVNRPSSAPPYPAFLPPIRHAAV